MEISKRLIESSLEELGSIFSWSARRPGDGRLILIGGWAVYVYNPYYGSVDIDLVSNSRTRQRLTNFLIAERGFSRERRLGMEERKLFKEIGGRKIDIDFGSLEAEDRFEGRSETLPMNILENRTVGRRLSSFDVEVPEISTLLVMKCKAAWDRNERLKNRSSIDPPWDRAKLVKDLSDIISLLESGETFDIRFLGNFFGDHEFLWIIFHELIFMEEAGEKYGIQRGELRKKIEDFVNALESIS